MHAKTLATYLLFGSLGVGSVPATAHADVKLPTVLDSHMVIQRDQPVRIWGTAEAGENVTVTLGEETRQATANNAGNWQVELEPAKSGRQTAPDQSRWKQRNRFGRRPSR